MISGVKISQLTIANDLQGTDYFPTSRGNTTYRISGSTIAQAITSNTSLLKADPNNLKFESVILELSGRNSIRVNTPLTYLSGTQIIETNSLSAALRVTQTGSGNAIVVEDSTNPDTTPFVINQTGQIISGTLSAWNALASFQITTDSSGTVPNSTLALKGNSNLAAGPSFIFYKGRGTHQTPLELNANDTLGNISFFGYSPESGTGNVPRYRSAAQILIQADGTPVSSLSSNPSRIMLSTTLSGDSNVTERLRITHAGKVGIGTTAPNELLTVSGNVSANTVYANLSGNAATSSQWQTARTFTAEGAINGSVSIDGSQNPTLVTTLSTGVVTDINISDTANISDLKLAPIVTPGKVSPGAVDFTGSQAGQVLTSLGSATAWQSLSSTTFNFQIADNSITTQKLDFQSVTESRIADNAVTTLKLSAGSVSTDRIADNAVTTSKILDGAVSLAKTTATPAATTNTLVSRDSLGNLSAVEVTASLKGNAQTATSFQTPMTLSLIGDVVGEVTFDGTNAAILETASTYSEPVWVIYSAFGLDHLVLPYTQGTSTESSNIVTISQQITSTRTNSYSGVFTQLDNNITIDFTDIPVSLSGTTSLIPINTNFLTYNLLTGTSLTAVYTNEQALTGTYTTLPSGNYIITNASLQNDNVTTTITLSSNITQYASGNVGVTFKELCLLPYHNLQEGHVINVGFLSGTALSGTYTQQTSGLYMVTDVLSTSPGNFTLSSSTFQSASGYVILYRCTIRDNYGVPVVTYVNTGNHILNFETPFDTPFYYGFAGSATALLSGLFTASIQREHTALQDQQNLQVRTILNNGSLSLFDFDRTSIMCFGKNQLFA